MNVAFSLSTAEVVAADADCDALEGPGGDEGPGVEGPAEVEGVEDEGRLEVEGPAGAE